ncbi:hypothetical protein Tco_1304863 [Tanacetum coccineum]
MDGQGAGSCVMLGSAPSGPSFSVSPSVMLSVAGRGEAGKGGSCVLIIDLVVMAKVGALEDVGRECSCKVLGGVDGLGPVLLDEEASSSKRIYVDGRSSSEIMYEHCFKNFDVNVKSRLRKANASLVGFSGETYHPLGLIDLRVTMRDPRKSKTVLLEFSVVKFCSPYDMIMGRTRMRSFRAVGLKNYAATLQRMMEKVLGDQKGRNVEVYLEEIVVKSETEESLIKDVEETLDKLQRVNVKIDPSKCTFGMEKSNFLGSFPKDKKKIGQAPNIDRTKRGGDFDGLLATKERSDKFRIIGGHKQSPNAYFLYKPITTGDRNLLQSDRKGDTEIGSHGKVLKDNLTKAPSQGDNRRTYGRNVKAFSYVFDDTLTSDATLSCEPTVSLLNKNKIDFKISFDESDDEEYMVIFDNNSFSYKIISVDTLKTDSENDNDKVDMPSFPSPEPMSDKDNDDDEIDIIQSLGGEDVDTRLRMVHSNEQGQDVFVSDAWRRLLDIRGSLVREWVLEFFGTCRFDDRILDFKAPSNLQFQLEGARRQMSWMEFVLGMGLHTVDEIGTNGFRRYWAESLLNHIYVGALGLRT